MQVLLVIEFVGVLLLSHFLWSWVISFREYALFCCAAINLCPVQFTFDRGFLTLSMRNCLWNHAH